jgi:hypothetical protein
MISKFVLFLSSFLLFACITFAQKNTTLKVSVNLPKTDTAAGVTLQLYLLPDTLLVASKVANSSVTGFTVTQFSKFILRLSSVTFENTEKTIGVLDKPVTTTFFLKRKNTTLGNVMVVSKKPLIKQEDDKTIVDATVLANSSTSAYEILEKTPGVIVDQDGNVHLGSMSTATVFINGREMKLSSEDLASLLKSLPATSVNKIELMRNPSAKYDAASSGGIVNIVLKKGAKLGSNGSVNAGYFQGVYSTKTAGFNINKSAGKINSYLSYQYTNGKNYAEITSERLIKTDSSQLTQKAFTTYPSVKNYVSAGVDVAFTKKLNIGYDLKLSVNDSKSKALNTNTIYRLLTQTLVSKNESDISNKNNAVFLGNSLSGKYKIDSSGSELTAALSYDYYKNTNPQVYTNRTILPVPSGGLGDGKSNNAKNIFTLQTDLTFKLPKKIILEAGYKATIGNSKNSAAFFYDSSNTGRKTDSFQTNTFRYRETISAAYLQLAKTFYGFTLKPGLRLETTNINGKQLIPKDTALSIKRTDLFPYIFLRHNLFKLFGTVLVGNAIYRRSIRRPYYEILNPYPKRIDDYLFDVGNPKLQPQFTTNYEVNITFDDFPVLAFGMNQTKNIFSNVTYQDDVSKIAYRTYDNLGKNKEFYFKVIGGIPPGGKYFIYVGAEYNHNEYKGFYQTRPLQFKNDSWIFFMYQELKLGKTFSMDLEGFFLTRYMQNFYILKNIGGLYFSANKSILKKKGNIIFAINDVLNTNNASFNLNQGNVNASGSRKTDSQKFGITLRYNFGLSKPNENKEFGMRGETKVN